MAARKKTTAEETDQAQEPAFDLEQLAACADFKGNTDLVRALLKPGHTYTKTEVKHLLTDFLERQVN
ncbi:hypothetical protein DSECCO2_362950 [anaerobic digester metagenome]